MEVRREEDLVREMSVRKKPEKAVPVLLDRLKVVESQILDKRPEDGGDLVGKPDSMLNNVKRKLEVMSKSMSRIREWEKHVVGDLCKLEKALDDAQHKPLEDVRKILEATEKDVGKLESYISAEEESVTLNDGGVSSSEPKQQQHPTPCEAVSAWAGLGAEDEIMKSETMSCLWKTIHCPYTKLRMCLLCLSVFTESMPIKKRPLIYWWMGEGLVSDEADGETVFQRLLDEGFIEGRAFTLGPWVRGVLISLAEKNGFFKFSALREGVRPRNSERRAFLWEGAMDDVPTDTKHHQVLTVFNINEKYLVSTKLEWLHHLEVLQMGRWQDSATHHIE